MFSSSGYKEEVVASLIRMNDATRPFEESPGKEKLQTATAN